MSCRELLTDRAMDLKKPWMAAQAYDTTCWSWGIGGGGGEVAEVTSAMYKDAEVPNSLPQWVGIVAVAMRD